MDEKDLDAIIKKMDLLKKQGILTEEEYKALRMDIFKIVLFK